MTMNRHGAVELSWGGGDHPFRLGLGEIEELERVTEMSVFLLYAAVSAQIPFAKLKAYSETIRLGLIGGGMVPVEAKALTRRYVDERPLVESVALAGAILRAGLERVHPGELEEALGEPAAPRSSGSTSAQSTAAPPSSESPTSGNSPSGNTRPSSKGGTEARKATSRSRRATQNSTSP